MTDQTITVSVPPAPQLDLSVTTDADEVLDEIRDGVAPSRDDLAKMSLALDAGDAATLSAAQSYSDTLGSSLGTSVALAQAAAASAATSAAAVPALTAHLGTDLSDVSTVTHGVTSPSTNTAQSGKAYGPADAVVSASPLLSITLKTTASGAGFVDIVDGAGSVLQSWAVTVASGLQTLSSFGNYVMPAGSRPYYRRVSGGALLFDTGGVAYQYNSSDVPSGHVTLSSVADTISMSYAVLASSNSVDTRLQTGEQAGSDADALFLQTGVDLTATASQQYGQTGFNTSTADAKMYAALVPAPRAAKLTGGSIMLSAPGVFTVRVFRPTGTGTYQWVYESAPVSVANGLTPQSFSLSAPFFKLLPGDQVVSFPISGGRVRFSGSGTGTSVVFNPSDFAAIGSVGPGAANSDGISFAFSTEEADGPTLADQIAALGGPVAGGAIRGPVALEKQRFVGTTPPENWTLGTGFSVSDGLAISGSGGWTTYALINAYTNIQRRMMVMRVKINDITSKFGLAVQPQASNAVFGAVAMVDGTANKLSIYEWNGVTTGAEIVFASLGTLTAAREYVLKVVKNFLASTVTLTDTVTQQSWSISHNFGQGADSTKHPFFDGAPGVMFFNGDIAVRWFDHYALYPRYLRAIPFTDSNGAGNVLSTIDPTWAQQLCMARTEGDIMLSGKGGDDMNDLLLRIDTELAPFRPEFVVIALGTNDDTQSGWRLRTQIAISKILALGAEPILVCSMPKGSATALGVAQNNDIRSGYFGNYRYIDFATAVSLNNDGQTWNPAYDRGDSTHVNAAGQAVYYQTVLTQAPYLLAPELSAWTPGT